MNAVSPDADLQRVLLLLGTARDATLTCELLERNGVAVQACTSALHLKQQIDAGAGAVLVAEECLEQGAHAVLRQAIDDQPSWSDLPILVLTRAGADSLAAGDALALLGNVTLLERPLRGAGLVSVVRTALRARCRQYEIEATLRRLEQARDAEAQALQRKDEFLAMLSHELRNPLAPIRTALHVMEIDDSDPARRRTLRQMMVRQVEHMVRLVDDLLEGSRLTRGKIVLQREPLDLRDALQRAVELSRPQIDAAGCSLQLRFTDAALPIEADPIRIAQVFSNLLNNAAKYGRPGGSIVVAAERSGDAAVVRVLDDGIGIGPETLPHVFEMFAQGKRGSHHLHGGLGIGLALVRSLVEQHGGSVSAHSAGNDRGAEFTVRLPLTLAEAHPTRDPDAAGRAGASRNASTGAMRVLVVDDNEDAANALALVVDSLGMERRVVHDGPTALSIVSSFAPDVVLLDIGMPGMDGYEVARRLRQDPRHDGVVLVAVTGWGYAQDHARCHSAGFDHHFSKPADVQALVALMESVRARRASVAIDDTGQPRPGVQPLTTGHPRVAP